eukprot:Skav223490  [mRNA]  locus=scaffold1160:9704:16560:- [translate_table: standard]
MHRANLTPSVIPYSATISACEKAVQWQQALRIFEEMQTSRVNPDTVSYNASISACEKAGRWREAVNLFEAMRAEDVSRDVYSFSATISACEKGAQWQQALNLFETMYRIKVIPNVFSYSAAISACEKSGQWQTALSLFERMPAAKVYPNVVSYSAVVGACEKGTQWQQALQLFEAMPSAKISPNAISYSAAICACGRGGHWQQALTLFEAMPSARIQPNIISYNATISACERGGAWRQALNLFDTMQEVQIEPDSATYNALLDSTMTSVHGEHLAAQIFPPGLPSLLRRMGSVDAEQIDLHGLSEGASQLTLRWWLSSVVAPRLCARDHLEFIIVTGYGRSQKAWHDSDIQTAALDLLRALKLRAEILPGNKGRIGVALRKEDLPLLESAGELFNQPPTDQFDVGSKGVKRVVELDGKFSNRAKGEDKPDKAGTAFPDNEAEDPGAHHGGHVPTACAKAGKVPRRQENLQSVRPPKFYEARDVQRELLIFGAANRVPAVASCYLGSLAQ